MTDSTAPTYSIEGTRDEDGSDRWFVADSNADWVAGPFDVRSQAVEAAAALADLGLVAGDLVTYESRDTRGNPSHTRAARIERVLGADLVAVSFPDVSRESGGGFDYDSPKRYTKCEDPAAWQALVDAAKAREREAWAAYHATR